MCHSHDANYMFTVGKSEECIFQWAIQPTAANWELDYLPFENVDGYSEKIKAFNSVFEADVQNIEDRSQISMMKANNSEIRPSSVKIELESVIGRKAVTGKNQLLISADNRLITTVGSVLIATKLPLYGSKMSSTMRLEQDILEPDCRTMFSESPEITAITICQKRKRIAIGTKQIDASILIWDITTVSFIKKIQIEGVYAIKDIKYCRDAKKGAILCSQKADNAQSVYYIDMENGIILGFCSFMYSHPDRIQAIDFFPDSNYKFMTCGIQHACQWEFKGNVLTFHEYPMVRIKDLMKDVKANELLFIVDDESRPGKDDEHQQESVPIRATFLCLLFLNNFAILGAEDGEVIFVYLAICLEGE